jgi:formylglycine-generating enzyme
VHALAAAILAATAAVTPRDGAEYVLVRAGEMEMGCVPSDLDCQSDERPRHRVRITADFYLARTEVTVRAYAAFAAATHRALPRPPSFNPGWRLTDHPIVNVTWPEANAYCEWASGRLPTEAEWEYAARAGGSGGLYYWGPNERPVVAGRPQASSADRAAREKYPRWEEAAGDYDDGFPDTAPVGHYPPNAWGLRDMAGNALEWCQDGYDRTYYETSPALDPRGPRAAGERALRGGSWQDPHRLLRVSDRFHYRPLFRASYVGFRCALDAP